MFIFSLQYFEMIFAIFADFIREYINYSKRNGSNDYK